jgi:hypothetical protein
MDGNKKEIFKAGDCNDEQQVKEVPVGCKPIYVFGANSIDSKCVGMIGFTIYDPDFKNGQKMRTPS